jgi:hypothetical protein
MTAPNHQARSHATWSASAASRRFACPGSLQAEARAPKAPTSYAAAWGTAAHEVAEWTLRAADRAADACLGTRKIIDGHEIEVDDEVVQTAAVYVAYVRERAASPGARLMIEQRFDLSEFKPPYDAGGTADAVIYIPGERLLEVVDLKGGQGIVVEVAENDQLRTYALGAMTANKSWPVDRIRVTIVQPRAPHKDGRIRSWDFDVVDLLEWTTRMLAAMHRAAAPDAPRIAGDHCKFCAAAATCPALRDLSLERARVWFDDETQSTAVPNSPDSLMPEEIAGILDAADMIDGWLNAVRAYAHAQAENGISIPGYQLVAKRATRKWARGDEEVAGELFVRFDLTADDLYERKLLSPAKVEKKIGAKRKAQIEDLWSAESTGTNLVRADKSTRPPVAAGNIVNSFDQLEQ